MMDRTKKIIEAALFMSGRWLSVEDLARIVGSGSMGAVKEAVKELDKEYAERGGGVLLSENDGRYRLEIEPEIRDKVYYLAPEPELTPALIKTLALIAYKQPIYQSGVVRVIGNRAYEYIRELRKKEFVSIKKKGRTKLISTTGRFNKYFGIPEDVKWKPEMGSKILEDAQKKLDDVVDEAEFDEATEALKEELKELDNHENHKKKHEDVLEQEPENTIEDGPEESSE